MSTIRDWHQRVRYTDHIVGEGERLFQELEKKQLEGMEWRNEATVSMWAVGRAPG